MLSPLVPSSLSSAAPRRAWHCRPVARKHPFLFGRRSQIPGPLGFFGPFLHPAHSSRRAGSPRLVPSLRRFACRASLEVSPRGHLAPRALFQPPAFSLVSIAGLAAAPTRLQPAPANSLSVNW